MSEQHQTPRYHKKGQSYAFFDVDDTIISLKSMFEFYKYWCLIERQDPARWKHFETTFDRLHKSEASRNNLNRAYYRFLQGESASELEAAGRRWFAHVREVRADLFHEQVLAALLHHAASGVEPVLVSGSFEALLRPLADEIGVTHILAAPLLLAGDGRLSGELGAPQTIGEGKRTAVLLFVEKHGGTPDSCFAYGDDISDLPMLECVGSPVVVGEGTALAAIAMTRAWSRIAIP